MRNLGKYELLALCLIVAACYPETQISSEHEKPPTALGESVPSEPKAEEFEGLYTSSFERSAFKPCNADEVWWTDFNTGNPHEMLVAMGLDADDPDWESKRAINRFVRVRGFVERADNPDEGFGHMGKYPGQIEVIELIEARQATAEELNRCLTS